MSRLADPMPILSLGLSATNVFVRVGRLGFPSSHGNEYHPEVGQGNHSPSSQRPFHFACFSTVLDMKGVMFNVFSMK